MFTFDSQKVQKMKDRQQMRQSEEENPVLYTFYILNSVRDVIGTHYVFAYCLRKPSFGGEEPESTLRGMRGTMVNS